MSNANSHSNRDLPVVLAEVDSSMVSTSIMPVMAGILLRCVICIYRCSRTLASKLIVSILPRTLTGFETSINQP